MLSQARDIQLASSESGSGDRAIFLLSELEKVHDRFVACLGALARTTAKPAADKLEYALIRFRVSEASLARRMIVRAACEYLMDAASPNDQRAISRLRTMDSDLARETSRHVHCWTSAKVSDDWEGYSRASKDIRRVVLAQVELERATLYPMLRNRASGGRSGIRLIPIKQFIAEETQAA